MKNLLPPFYTVEILPGIHEDFMKKHPKYYTMLTLKYFFYRKYKRGTKKAAFDFANEIEAIGKRIFVIRHDGQSTAATRVWEVKL